MTAAVRTTPTVANGGSGDGTLYTNAVDVEIEALWKVSATWLTSIGGTGNAVTASSDSALVGPITGYSRPMAFWYQPAAANTSSVTMDIDGVGVIDVKDHVTAALQGGEFSTSGVYLLVFDGTQLIAVTVTAGSGVGSTSGGAPGLIVNDTKSSGVDGGSFTTGAYRQRTLNTVVRNTIGATLSSNQVTLTAGSYYVEWSCPAHACQNHKSRLFNVTDSSVVALGTTEKVMANSAPYSVQSRSMGCAYFTITSSKAFELEHRCSDSSSGSGFGNAAGFGDNEVYSEMRVWRQ
jgi:hypothetical protein